MVKLTLGKQFSAAFPLLALLAAISKGYSEERRFPLCVRMR